MSTSGSDSDFDGFTLEEASEAVARSANLVRSVPDESDVDISEMTRSVTSTATEARTICLTTTLRPPTT